MGKLLRLGVHVAAARGLPPELSRGVHVRYRFYGDKAETKTPPHAKQGINVKFNTKLCRQEIVQPLTPDFCAFVCNDGVEFDIYGSAPAGHERRRPRSIHSVESADRMQLLDHGFDIAQGQEGGEQGGTKAKGKQEKKKKKKGGSAGKYEVDYFGNKKAPGATKKPTMSALADQNEELKREIERLKELASKKSRFCVVL